MYSYGKTLAEIRKKKRITQQMLADQMTQRGLPTQGQAVSAWEKETHNMNVYQFLTVCDLLEISDINQTFHVAVEGNPLTTLSEEGKRKVYEYIDLLHGTGKYERETAELLSFPRWLDQYDLAASAGPGEFMDSDSCEKVEVGPEVPLSADFGVRLNGDSMEPTFMNHSVVWVHKQDVLESGEIGVFYLNGNAFCKRIMQYSDCIKLLSDNPGYPPIVINENDDFKVYGKVVANTVK